MLKGLLSKAGIAVSCLGLMLMVPMISGAEDSANIKVTSVTAEQKVTVELSEASWYGRDMSVTCYAPGYNVSGSIADNMASVVYLDQIKAAQSFSFVINKPVAAGDYKLVLGCKGAKLEKSFVFGTANAQTPNATAAPGGQAATAAPAATVTDKKADTAKLKAPKAKVKAGKKKATVSWNKIKGAKGYKIYMSTKKNKGFKVKTTVKAKKTKCVIKKLKKGKTYYFKVAAYTGSGKKLTVGKLSKVVKAKIK